MIEIELPFSGFYESYHDQKIDEAIESYFNYDPESGEDIEISEEIFEAIWDADIDWGAIRKEYSKEYVEAFGDRYGLTLTFVELQSPREYNFGTDRVFASIKEDEINEIRKEVEAHEKWAEEIKERFTDRSGFWSNYSNDSKDTDWTREKLDECQYRVILEFWLNNIQFIGSYWEEEECWIADEIQVSEFQSINNAYEKIEAYRKEHNE